MKNIRWVARISPLKIFGAAVCLNLLITVAAFAVTNWMRYSPEGVFWGPGYSQLFTLLLFVAILIDLFAILSSLFKRAVIQAFFMFLAALTMSLVALALFGPALFTAEGVQLQEHTYYLGRYFYPDQYFGTKPPYPDSYELLQCAPFPLFAELLTSLAFLIPPIPG